MMIYKSVNLIINILVEAYAEGAQIKMNPSVLKTVAPKREPRQNRVMTPVVENQSTEQQASENVSNTQVSNEPVTPVVEVEKSSEPKAE